MAVLVASLVPPCVISAELDSLEHGIRVRADGSVAIPLLAGPSSSGTTNPATVLAFGLPRRPPVQRWLEDDAPPICHTTWEKDGIRYTETVLVTGRTPGDWATTSLPAAEAVVMVRISGENFTNNYAEASAEFSVKRAGRALNLELRNDLVFSISGVPNSLVAVLEIPASGIVTTNGSRLEFQANMPPGNTGAMVVKLPLRPPQSDGEIEPLRDLQFDQELQRVKRHWARRGHNGRAQVTFDD